MNTNRLRREIWESATGQPCYQLADIIEQADGPLLRNREGQLLRSLGDVINQQSDPLIEDSDIEKVCSIASEDSE